MIGTKTYQAACKALREALGAPSINVEGQSRFVIVSGHKRTAIDVIAFEAAAAVSVHTLPPHHAEPANPDHLEFVAEIVNDCFFKQYSQISPRSAKKHKPAPAPQIDLIDVAPAAEKAPGADNTEGSTDKIAINLDCSESERSGKSVPVTRTQVFALRLGVSK